MINEGCCSIQPQHIFLSETPLGLFLKTKTWVTYPDSVPGVMTETMVLEMLRSTGLPLCFSFPQKTDQAVARTHSSFSPEVIPVTLTV